MTTRKKFAGVPLTIVSDARAQRIAELQFEQEEAEEQGDLDLAHDLEMEIEEELER